jgi:hypothetical protein
MMGDLTAAHSPTQRVCDGCGRPLGLLGLAVVRVGNPDVARRWHAWCWLTQGCPSAPGKGRTSP